MYRSCRLRHAKHSFYTALVQTLPLTNFGVGCKNKVYKLTNALHLSEVMMQLFEFH